MKIHLDYTDRKLANTTIHISGSKSESNRMLILKQWYPNLILENLSDSDDTNHLKEALNSMSGVIDIGHAGTAMRFLTAYFSVLEGKEVILTGSERMQQRPIKILVDALRSMGATIEYVRNEGYPPLRIKGSKLSVNKVRIPGNVSSQYISALLLIAPHLENGLEIELIEEITSRPYLEMTLELIKQLGITPSWEGSVLQIPNKEKIDSKTIVIESDWSSASYYYSLVAMSPIGASVTLTSYKNDSLQGDRCLAVIYKDFGVETVFENNTILLTKISLPKKEYIELDLRNAPDIAQTIAVTCFGLGLCCDFTGLHTLKIKETDRLVALREELQKFGAEIRVTDNSLHLLPSLEIHSNIMVKTYNDHRMAMAFAPLSIKVPLFIEDADVVTKSYVGFWSDLEKCFK